MSRMHSQYVPVAVWGCHSGHGSSILLVYLVASSGQLCSEKVPVEMLRNKLRIIREKVILLRYKNVPHAAPQVLERPPKDPLEMVLVYTEGEGSKCNYCSYSNGSDSSNVLQCSAPKHSSRWSSVAPASLQAEAYLIELLIFFVRRVRHRR